VHEYRFPFSTFNARYIRSTVQPLPGLLLMQQTAPFQRSLGISLPALVPQQMKPGGMRRNHPRRPPPPLAPNCRINPLQLRKETTSTQQNYLWKGSFNSFIFVDNSLIQTLTAFLVPRLLNGCGLILSPRNRLPVPQMS